MKTREERLDELRRLRSSRLPAAGKVAKQPLKPTPPAKERREPAAAAPGKRASAVGARPTERGAGFGIKPKPGVKSARPAPRLRPADKENAGPRGAGRRGSIKPGACAPKPKPVPAAQPPASTPRQVDMADWSAAMESEMENLTGRLDTMKRESLRPALKGDTTDPLPQSATREILRPIGGNQSSLAARLQALQRPAEAACHPVVEAPEPSEDNSAAPAMPLDGRSLAACARQLFDAPEFAQLCERGLNAQLQRTRDGATDKSRIAELAALVKTLRRGLKEMMQKSTAFVDASLRFERGAAAQAEGLQLAHDSASKQQEAEVAALKRDSAQAAAAHKQAAASWHMELDLLRAEASHAKRELQRMESERDRAREEARKAAEQAASLEGAVKGMKKETGQQLRELQVESGASLRSLQEAQEAHGRREAQLQEQLADAQGAVERLRAQCGGLEAEVSGLRQEVWSRGEELAALTKAKEGLQADCQQLATGLAEHEQLRQEAAAASDSSASEAAALRRRCAALAQEAAGQQAALQALAGEAQAEAAASGERAAELELQLQAAEAAAEAAQQEAGRLRSDKGELEAALGAARQDAGKLEASLAGARAESDSLVAELEAAGAREAAATEAAAQAGATAADAAERLQQEGEARRAVAAELAVKAARLARIEGEFEAMQEAIGTGSVDQAEMLGRLISRVAGLEGAVADAHRQRAALHNQLVNLRGNIRVFCRVRPHPDPALLCLGDGCSVRAEAEGREQTFAFDRVFGAAASQADVFQEVSELVQSALDGYQVCLFSYGQTGAGKTHTMQGGRAGEQQGIIPRAIAKILEEAARLREEGWEYTLEASFVEVYNESLRDLLAEGKGRDAGRLPDANVIKHHPTGGPSTVVGAVRTRIGSAEDAAAMVRRAAAARAVEATAMNATSSRSHSVFMLYVVGRHAGSSTHLLGGLNLVDLAGSERLDRSQAEGQRQKEACSINKSLSALGDVFSALAARSAHVPYRNSKLTHLLQPCLGGDGKTLMFVNVNPEAASLGETLCSLRFAAKVNACQTAARGGARRHVSLTGSARGSAQGTQRQQSTARGSAAGPGPGGAKRKAAPAAVARISKPRLG